MVPEYSLARLWPSLYSYNWRATCGLPVEVFPLLDSIFWAAPIPFLWPFSATPEKKGRGLLLSPSFLCQGTGPELLVVFGFSSTAVPSLYLLDTASVMWYFGLMASLAKPPDGRKPASTLHWAAVVLLQPWPVRCLLAPPREAWSWFSCSSFPVRGRCLVSRKTPGIKCRHAWYDILPRMDWDFIWQLTTGAYTLCWTWMLG